MSKGKYSQQWTLVKAAALEHQGKVSDALELLDLEINQNNRTIEQTEHFVNLSLRLGLLERAEEKLIGLLHATSDNKKKKVAIVYSLIFIYSSHQDYSLKLTEALIQYGKLVDQGDCYQEGQYLSLFLMLTSNKNIHVKDYVEDFRTRLNNYTCKFPNSPIFRQGTIDTGNADTIITSMRELVGISDEKLNQWKKNRQHIRHGKIPIPFCFLNRFLDDVSDIFVAWVYANHMSEGKLEYKLKHANIALNFDLCTKIKAGKSILIDETSLLVLNELDLLSTLLQQLPLINILKPTYEQLSRNSHPIMGSIYSQTPQKIIQTLNKYLSKINLIETKEQQLIFNDYSNAINSSGHILLSDDLNLSELTKHNCNEAECINIFNVLEFFYRTNILSNHIILEKISAFCKLGVYRPSMNVGMLSRCFLHTIDLYPKTAISNSLFRPIFDKIFDLSIETQEAVRLLMNLFLGSLFTTKKRLEKRYVSELIYLFLLRHPYKPRGEFYAFWFIYCCASTKPSIGKLIQKSEDHSYLWNIYQEIMGDIEEHEFNLTELLENAVNQIPSFPPEYFEIIHSRVKSAFIPMTMEYDKFEELYQNMSIRSKL